MGPGKENAGFGLSDYLVRDRPSAGQNCCHKRSSLGNNAPTSARMSAVRITNDELRTGQYGIGCRLDCII